MKTLEKSFGMLFKQSSNKLFKQSSRKLFNRSFLLLVLVILSLTLSGCSRLEMLKWEGMTGDKWLATHSHMPVSIGTLKFILAEPSSTIIVFALGVVILLAGLSILKSRGTSKSRLFWGIALILWAISTFSAGISYQAFSYEIKCAGRDLCLWTSWWEISYLILFVTSMNTIVVATSFSSAQGTLRKAAIGYGVLNGVIYLGTVLYGALTPNQFMASFECMVMFAAPTFLVLFIINTLNYVKYRNKLDVLLIMAWILMLLTVVAYFGFYVSDYASVLWEKGIWFNANDVLHITLILWIVYFQFFLSKKIIDARV